MWQYAASCCAESWPRKSVTCRDATDQIEFVINLKTAKTLGLKAFWSPPMR